MFISAIHGEKPVENIEYMGAALELVSCPETIWCGSIGYAPNLSDEPDVESLLQKYQRLCSIPKLETASPDWSCCISIDYWQEGTVPRGIMFAQQVLTETQAAEHDVFRMPGSLYFRIAGTKENALAAFAQEDCGLHEFFGFIKEAMAKHGYKPGRNGAQEIEMYKNSGDLAYAYVQAEHATE